ncbi:serine hydrolase [Aeromicrobium sp.]|uniref:serine hydrolase domain-containing protein n=1 Tax=Aeromicrobium sp. TaxID=1871063 RepID=UPI001995C19F|nr:serine hydrolase [Aeromicrobium sp.]
MAGWRSPRPGDPADTYKFLADLRSSGTHGDRFQYCSAATDVLAWLAEIWTGRRYPEIASTHLWARLGSEHDALVTVDASGFAFANGGIACTARDLARAGRLVLDGGRRGDKQIVPQAWIEATRTGGRPEAAVGSLFSGHPSCGNVSQPEVGHRRRAELAPRGGNPRPDHWGRSGERHRHRQVLGDGPRCFGALLTPSCSTFPPARTRGHCGLAEPSTQSGGTAIGQCRQRWCPDLGVTMAATTSRSVHPQGAHRTVQQ